MSVIAFSRPSDGMTYYKDVLDLMRVMQDIMKSPGNVSTSIDDLSKQLQAEFSLSDAKKIELANAQETIAQAKEAQEDLLAAKAEHAARVKMELADLDKKYELYHTSVKDMNDEKAANQKVTDKIKSDAAATLGQAQKLTDAANAKAMKADALAKVATDKLAAHESNVTEFEKLKAQHQKDMEAKEAEVTNKGLKLAQDIQALDLRKKKFEDALKG